MENDLKIIELFSGIGGFSKGLADAGFNITEHYFSEIDKHAIANYKYNFPNAKYIGSVTDISGRDFTGIDIITFGSPCQDFSLAGKREGMDGQRSVLILEAIRLITELRPPVFIWENVKGAFSSNAGADFWGILQAFANIGGYRLEWQLLNTKWFLPQNRERIYLVGHLAGSERSFGNVFPISEDNCGINERSVEARSVRTLTAGGNSGGLHSSMTLICDSGKSRQLEKREIMPPLRANTGAGHGNYIIDKNGRNVSADTDVSGTIDANYHKGPESNFGARTFLQIGAIRGRNPKNPTSRESGLPTEQMLEINKEGVSNTLTSVQKDNVVITQEPRGNNKGADFSECPTISANSFQHNNHLNFLSEPSRRDGTHRIHNDIAPTIQSHYGTGGDNIPYVNNIRRLTEIECERLQGFPDDWTKFGNYAGTVKEVPKTQRYKMLGNAVTVKVVEEIGKRLLNDRHH